MRAKIEFTTDLSDVDIQARFHDHKWLPEFEQNSAEADAVLAAILDTIAKEHKDSAKKGNKLVLYNRKTESDAIFGEEKGVKVIRIKNDNMVLLKQGCEDIVRFLTRFSEQNGKNIKFENNIEILEIRNHMVVIEGEVIKSKKSRAAHAKTRKMDKL